jgi:hypothetical protein
MTELKPQMTQMAQMKSAPVFICVICDICG